ncbi:MAG: RICIN domain-containing protein [Clostridia bacterium]|nr:RICIN domain-containing protein [Clostridia bacterium]
MKFKIKKSYYRLFSVFLSLVMIVISIPIMSINANAVDEDFSGIWLFNNVKYDTKFIHINDNNGTSQEGEIIELHNYNKYWALRWYIISVGGGYYKIESVISDKVLTAPTGYNNDIVTQTDYDDLSTQQWKFIEQSDGTYKISPRSNLNYYLAAGDISDEADQNLEIRTVRTDSSDKWNLIDINYQYHVSIQHYYDFEYSNRFWNVGSDISDYQDVCSDILSQLFNVKVTYSVKSFYSSADYCFDGDGCATHKTHASLRNNIISMYGEGNATTARVIWTGHTLTSWQSNYLQGQETIVITVNTVADYIPPETSEDIAYIFNYRIYTLLHETSHVLGALDHYCYEDGIGKCSNNGCYTCRVDSNLQTDGVCMMKDLIFDLNDRLEDEDLAEIYCDFCMSNTEDNGIPKHLSNHH